MGGEEAKARREDARRGRGGGNESLGSLGEGSQMTNDAHESKATY